MPLKSIMFKKRERYLSRQGRSADSSWLKEQWTTIFYIMIGAVLFLFSIGDPEIALIGFSFFLSLFLVFAFSPLYQKFEEQDRTHKVLIIVSVTLILFLPSFFITPFLTSVLVLLSNYFIITLIFTLSQKLYFLCSERNALREDSS